MAKKKEIRIGKYLTYEDQQSLEETHEMVVKALPGQSYVVESMNRVSTTQVTGDALMKVAVGGKGGFAAGTAGDVREKKKELNAELIRMEKKEVWMQRLEVMQTLGLERDYDDFTHQGDLDASDHMRNAEFYLAGTPELDRIREGYEEICGYRGAWKYVGLNGAEHRRYEISIQNTLNLQSEKPITTLTSFWSAPPNKREPRAYHCHHNDLYKALNQYYYVHGEDESYLDDWMTKSNQSHVGNIIWELGKQFDGKIWAPSTYKWLNEKPKKPSKQSLELKERAEALEKKRRLEALKKAPKLEDWRIVYKWELTKEGKIMFANEKI